MGSSDPAPAAAAEGGHDNCDELLDQLEHLLHGELDAARQAALRAHLDACPPCFEQVDFQAQLKRLIAARCAEQPPSALAERILTMLRDATPTS